MKVSAKYTTGQTAEIEAVEINLSESHIILPNGDIWPYFDLILVSRDTSTGWLIYRNKEISGARLTLMFSGGMADPARDYLGRVSKKLTGDSKWHFVRWQIMTGLVIIALLVLFFALYGYANRAVVAVIPDKWAVKAGDLVLDELYRQYATESCHSPGGDKALLKLIGGLRTGGLPYDLRVQVVDSGEVNALTAPGGRIVILNGLLKEAESPAELAGVLAHEAGHVKYKHPMQGVVNVLGLSVLGSMFGGDAATIAVVVFSMSYSRDMERQADKYALRTMAKSDISAKGLLAFFERLQGKDKGTIGHELKKIMSTHPLTGERMAYIQDHIAAQEKNLTQEPILTEQEWKSLKAICRTQTESAESS
ncbi:MAG TPA: M48 family metallopeptidase [Sphingomonadales bacterium]|nr:M48 family metallopeptidase [Sphingomonadales bacterium]